MERLQPNHPQHGQAGFTLVELVITIVLVGIIAATVGMLLIKGTQAYIEEDQRAAATSQGRLGLERMARDIRTIPQASAIVGPIANPSSSLSFSDLTGLSIAYARNGATGTLDRTEGAGLPVILADGVATLEFRHYDKAGALTTTPANIWQVRIDLTVTKGGESQVFRMSVYPRNFA
jgi:prepilin-type N-terminal cleavage/methylation domain-containing protein